MEMNIIDLTHHQSSSSSSSSSSITDFSVSNNTLISADVNLYWDTYLWAFTNIILLISILGGNALTIIAVHMCRRLRCLISNMFICSLAISDFMVGLSLPYHLAFYLGSNWGHVHVMCLIRFYLIIFACCVSILTLITISIDRYIAIVYPLHYRRFITRRAAALFIAFTWFVGATVAAVPMFWNNFYTAFRCEFDEVLPLWYIAGILTPGFVVIWTLMSFMYWRIVKEACKQATKLNNLKGNSKSRNSHPDWRSVQVVMFVMGCFSICWLPYFIVACAQIFNIYEVTPLLYKVTFSLAMTNSALNPVIYAWKNSNFRKAFLRLLHCKSPNYNQTPAEFSKASPISLKCCCNNDWSKADKQVSILSPNTLTNHNIKEFEMKSADIEICVTNASKFQIKSENLSQIYTVE